MDERTYDKVLSAVVNKLLQPLLADFTPHVREIRFWNINVFLKHIVSFSKLPNCRVIFPHPPHNSVMHTVPVEFVLCINN